MNRMNWGTKWSRGVDAWDRLAAARGAGGERDWVNEGEEMLRDTHAEPVGTEDSVVMARDGRGWRLGKGAERWKWGHW